MHVVFLEPLSHVHFMIFIKKKKRNCKDFLIIIKVVFPYVPTYGVTIGGCIYTWVSLAIIWIMHGLSKKEFIHTEFLMMHTLLLILLDNLELFLHNIKFKTKFLQLVLIMLLRIPLLFLH